MQTCLAKNAVRKSIQITCSNKTEKHLDSNLERQIQTLSDAVKVWIEPNYLSIYIDSRRKIAVFYFASADSLRAPLDLPSECLEQLKTVDTKLAVVRCDSSKDHSKAYFSSVILPELSHAMKRLCIKESWLIFNIRQFYKCLPVLQVGQFIEKEKVQPNLVKERSADSSSQELGPSTLRVMSPMDLKTFCVTQEMIAKMRNSTGELNSVPKL